MVKYFARVRHEFAAGPCFHKCITVSHSRFRAIAMLILSLFAYLFGIADALIEEPSFQFFECGPSQLPYAPSIIGPFLWKRMAGG